MKKKINSYNIFADYYDVVMSHINYKGWADYIFAIFNNEHIKPGNILEIGCGTGTLAGLLFEKGFSVTGIDISPCMIRAANNKFQHHANLMFLVSDILEYNTYKKYEAVTCLHDTVNHFITPRHVKKLFRKVSELVTPGGIFIFDITTEYNILNNFYHQTFEETFPDFSYVWTNDYSRFTKKSTSALVFRDTAGDKRVLGEEHYLEKIYTPKLIEKLLKKTGWRDIKMYDTYTFESPNRASEGIHFVCRK